MSPLAKNADSTEVNPRAVVVPIMKEIETGKLMIVGTGFYVTRYGLFLTAQHVLNELVMNEPKELDVGYILHPVGNNNFTHHIRRIRSVSFLQIADLALDIITYPLTANPCI